MDQAIKVCVCMCVFVCVVWVPFKRSCLTSGFLFSFVFNKRPRVGRGYTVCSESPSPIVRRLVRSIDSHQLQGTPGRAHLPAVSYFTMGGEEWHASDSWPPDEDLRLARD